MNFTKKLKVTGAESQPTMPLSSEVVISSKNVFKLFGLSEP